MFHQVINKKMKKNIILTVLSMFVFFGYSQEITKNDIIGIWQMRSKELNSGWFDNYQFFPNGEFKFNTNQNDATKRIISIGGKYSVKKNTLILEVSYSKEIVGGYLVRSETSGGSGWELKDGKVKTIFYKSKMKSYLTIEKCADTEGIECSYIDKVIYYKLENDPNNYD